MVAITLEKGEFIKKCKEVYERNKQILEKEHYGKVVALYEEGVAGIGDNTDAAYRQAIKKHPDKIFYFRRVGRFSAADYVL